MHILQASGWVEISSAGGDVSFQKSGTEQIRLQYTTGLAPADVDGSFRVADNDWRLLPAVSSKVSLWASAFQGDLSVAVEDLA